MIREMAERDPSYCPYCLHCPGLRRMVKVETFYWKCKCGAEHDERISDAEVSNVQETVPKAGHAQM